MQHERGRHTATLLDNGTVLVVGGYGDLGNGFGHRADAEIYDPALNRWSAAPGLGTPRDGHTATLLQDGRVLVFGGGTTGFRKIGVAEVYDPDLGIWLPGAPTAWYRIDHTATLLADGTVLIAGGESNGTPGSRFDSEESYLFIPR